MKKTEMVRQAMETLGENSTPTEIHEHIKEKHNVDIKNSLISTYVHNEKKKKPGLNVEKLFLFGGLLKEQGLSVEDFREQFQTVTEVCDKLGGIGMVKQIFDALDRVTA